MQPAVLLGLLGAAVVAAVSSVPVDNRNHNEEMVTRCIIEVLSNALLKSNAPPITPECRQVLKKSGKEVKDEEKSENENKKFEVRLLRDSKDALEAHTPSSREEMVAPGKEDRQDPTKEDNEKWALGGGHSREEAGEAQGSLYPSASQVSEETKTHHSKKVEEEDREEYQKKEHGEDNEKKYLGELGETQNAFLNNRNHASLKNNEELVARYDKQSPRHPEEETHSREETNSHEETHSPDESSQASREEVERSQEKHSQESKSQPGSQEESEESEENATAEVVKRLRQKHHHGRSRSDRFSQEGKPPSEERRHSIGGPEDSNMGMASLGEKKDYHITHFMASEEEPKYGEVRNYPGAQTPEDLEEERYGGRGSEEYRVPRPHSEESQEEEDKRNHPNSELDNIAQRYSEESEEVKGHEAGKGLYHRGRGGDPSAYSAPDTREEKKFLGEGYHHVPETLMDKARRHPQGEWKEQDRNYLSYGEGNGEDGVQGKWQGQEDLQDSKENREEAYLQEKHYFPHHTAEKRKRLGELLSPYYDPTQWKSSHFDRKDNMDDNFLENEEENGLTLNEKNFFPEYNYDWWEKKPFEEDVNWGYEKRNLARTPKLELKRQYDRVAELDQLLHYRKKAVEFPDFYDSEEPLSTRQVAENEKDRANQRVLTEEEQRQLENLAAMDLELQKIAEKFSGNRRG
ncbi:PREDICTED: secretogranin-1 [Chrysochloris asiatica]|uniref:Secretogranin-1 n=1 Tax=Chrysochloris asiatica TaxID=185453 RepID=A0A9B0U173_CHRAS|nr:PREDICTED: secretogranin-1 [Chrysochloris asiatica]